MDAGDFEGTLVLEKLSSIGKLDEFFMAVDSDDFERAASLMKTARVDSKSIDIVIKKMAESE